MGSIFIHKDSKRVTAVGGSIQTSTLENLQGVLMHIIVRPKTDGTLFDFQIIDENGTILYERDNDEEINDQVAIPLKGSLTARVTNSTKDEAYRIYLAIREL